jgi:putative transposase
MMANKREILITDKFYHIYNHSNGNENLFIEKNDYILFLKKYETYATPYFDIYCYCLMPNHFHFLVKVKSMNDLKLKGYNESENIQNFLSHKLGSFFNSYTKSYNINYNRKGSLFNQSFHRIAIDTEEYLRKLVIYIHFNPVNHGFFEKPEEWFFSSFKNIYNNPKQKKEYDIVIESFGDKQNYMFCHLKDSDLDDEYKLEI